MRGYIVEIYM